MATPPKPTTEEERLFAEWGSLHKNDMTPILASSNHTVQKRLLAEHTESKVDDLVHAMKKLSFEQRDGGYSEELQRLLDLEIETERKRAVLLEEQRKKTAESPGEESEDKVVLAPQPQPVSTTVPFSWSTQATPATEEEKKTTVQLAGDEENEEAERSKRMKPDNEEEAEARRQRLKADYDKRWEEVYVRTREKRSKQAEQYRKDNKTVELKGRGKRDDPFIINRADECFIWLSMQRLEWYNTEVEDPATWEPFAPEGTYALIQRVLAYKPDAPDAKLGIYFAYPLAAAAQPDGKVPITLDEIKRQLPKELVLPPVAHCFGCCRPFVISTKKPIRCPCEMAAWCNMTCFQRNTDYHSLRCGVPKHRPEEYKKFLASLKET